MCDFKFKIKLSIGFMNEYKIELRSRLKTCIGALVTKIQNASVATPALTGIICKIKRKYFLLQNGQT